MMPAEIPEVMEESEPNKIGETYRKRIPVEVKHNNLEFIDFNEDGTLLIGASNLNGRIWSGALFVLDKLISTKTYLTSYDFEYSLTDCCALEPSKFVISDDNGSLYTVIVDVLKDVGKYFIKIFDVKSEHDDSILKIDLLLNRTKIISCGMDKSIKVWNAETFLVEKSFTPAHGDVVTCVSHSLTNDNAFVSTSLDNTCLIWDIRREKPAHLLAGDKQNGFTSCCFINNYHTVIGKTNGDLSLVDIRNRCILDNFFGDRSIHKIKYNSKLNNIAVCMDGTVIHLFETRNDRFSLLQKFDRHNDFVRGLTWHPDTNDLFSCGWDGQVYSHTSTINDNEDITLMQY